MAGSNNYSTYYQLFDSPNYNLDDPITPPTTTTTPTTTSTTPVTRGFTYEPKMYERKHSEDTIDKLITKAGKKRTQFYWNKLDRFTSEENESFLAHMDDRIAAVKKYNEHLSSVLNPSKPTTTVPPTTPPINGQTGGQTVGQIPTTTTGQTTDQTPKTPTTPSAKETTPSTTTVTDDIFSGLSANDAALLKKAREYYPFTSLEEVKLYQRMLGVNPDGDFGQNTITAMNQYPNLYKYWTDRAIKFGFGNMVGVYNWQKANGITNPDGAFGPTSEQLYNKLNSNNMTEKKQQGGTISDVQAQVKELVNQAAQGNKEASAQIQQIVNAAQNGDPQAQQILQLIQQEIQAMQMAKRGAKLNYLKSLKGDCAEGEEVVYFQKGGNICKKCEKVNKNQIGGLLAGPAAIQKLVAQKAAAKPVQSLIKLGDLGRLGAIKSGKVYDGGTLPEFNVTADQPVYDGGTLPEVTINGSDNFDDASFNDNALNGNATLKSLELLKKFKNRPNLLSNLNK